MENIENENNENLSLTDQAISKIKYSKGYMIFLIVILGLAHLLDEYATLAPTFYQSSMIWEFFESTEWMEYNEALGFITRLSAIGMVLMIFGMLYKGLMDRFGRRIIFIISAAGMTLGVIIMILSQNYWIYFIGSTIMGFFVMNDMQYQFINEETPTKWRAQAFSIAKIIGLLGLLAVPLIRRITIVEGSENWRPIMYLPVIVGLIVVISSIFFLKETRAFRILQEQRKIDPEAHKKEKINIRIAWKALKKMPTWDQYKWIVILGMLFVPFAMLNQAHTDNFMEQAGISLDDRNIVITISTICVGVAYIAHGIFTDKVGRKPAYALNCVVTIVLLPVEYYAMLNYNLVLAGITQGLRIGAFWNITDVNRFMMIENVPTRMRGNAQAIAGLMMFIPIFPIIFINSYLVENLPYVQQALMAVGIPVNLAALILVIWKLKETKNVDLTKIEG